MFVNDDIKINDYAYEAFPGKELDGDKQKEILSYLSDFFGAYYGERQSIIDNYLAPNADKSRFQGLDGLLTFKKIEDVSKVYDPLTALVTLTVTDKNGNDLRQNFTVTVIEQDGRYYVLRLDTKINKIIT